MKTLNLFIPFYQSLEELGLTGYRNTLERFEKYGLKSLLKPDYQVLDIGCNTGFFSITVSHYVKHVDALDNKKLNILQGRIARKRLNIKNIRFFHTGYEKFRSNKKYDVVLSFAVHHWVGLSLHDYAKKIHSMMKKGGILYFESHDLSSLDSHFDRKLDIVKSAGFSVVRTIDMKDDGNRVCAVLKRK